MQVVATRQGHLAEFRSQNLKADVIRPSINVLFDFGEHRFLVAVGDDRVTEPL